MKEVLLYSYSALVPILLTVIAFWLIRFVRKVDHLSELLRRMELALTGRHASCIEKHKSINATLSTHETEIGKLKEVTSQQGIDIEVIKEHINQTP